MTFGVSADGFTPKTFDDLKKEEDADLLANVDNGLDLSPETPLGAIEASFVEKLAELWELAEQIYRIPDPEGAEGVTLDNLASISGVLRRAATATKVAVTLNLDASTTVPQGTLFFVTGAPQFQFPLDVAVVSTTSGNYPGNVTCTTLGKVPVAAGTLTGIVTPVAGLNSVTNAADGQTGRDVETDTELRARREEEIFLPGSGTEGAIRADVLAIDGVLDARVRQNNSNVWADPDLEGNLLPPHSFEVVVWDGDPNEASNDTIAQTIWDSKPAGIQSYAAGSTLSSGTAVDELGKSHTIEFLRAPEILVYLKYTIKAGTNYVGDTAFKSAIVEASNARQTLGKDAIAAFYEGLPTFLSLGVEDVTVFGIGLSASPGSDANVTVNSISIARFDTTRIDLTVI